MEVNSPRNRVTTCMALKKDSNVQKGALWLKREDKGSKTQQSPVRLDCLDGIWTCGYPA